MNDPARPTAAQHPTTLSPVKESLEKLKAGDWAVEHPAEAWQPRLDEASSPAQEAAYLNLDL